MWEEKSDFQVIELFERYLSSQKSINRDESSKFFFNDSLKTEVLNSRIDQNLKILQSIELEIMELKSNNEIDIFKTKIILWINEYKAWVNNHHGEDLFFPIETKGMGHFENFFGLLTSELLYMLRTGDFNFGYSNVHLGNYHIRSTELRKWCHINKINKFLEQELDTIKNMEPDYIQLYKRIEGIKSRWEGFEYN